jgi:beta-lactamase regulating signal transducer with metallopeptidase domain/DUF4097 and DUF4098 domain-containing protein YvlB
MIPLLIEAALRMLAVALVVAAGLRLLRVSNVLAQKSAWCIVLVAALAMPLLMRWQWLSASAPIRVQTHFAGQRDDPPSSPASASVSSHSSGTASQSVSNFVSSTVAQPAEPVFEQNIQDASALADSLRRGWHAATAFFTQFAALATLLYLSVCVLLLARLLYGLGAIVTLWATSEPVCTPRESELIAGLNLRSSQKIASPVALASGVVLPVDYAQWDRQKLRVVLAHERSHLRQGDFYLQTLAGLHAALFWFSPLAWWLKRKLSDLGEAISDHAGLEVAASRSSYAQILLEFAALPRPTLLGVAMANSSGLSNRIERFLNESSFHQAFAGSRRRALLAVLLVPTTILAFTAMIRVEAKMSPLPAVISKSVTQASVASQHIAAQAVRAAVAPASDTSFMLAAESGQASEATFERTLSVTGQAQLNVGTSSGNIHLTRGSGNQVHIVGRVKSNKEGSEEKVKEVAANPPIEQTGDIIRIGAHREDLKNISISYEIQTPENTLLSASSGSGDITVEGVGENAKISTGSGSIHAIGLHGGFSAETGSGNITAEQMGEGFVKVETGSGNLELRNLRGGLKAETGSGNIRAAGAPTSDWKLETGSGNIELTTGNAAMTLEASTGSGSIHTDQAMLTEGSSNHHHVTGKINGGGPAVRVETGSGEIRVH